MFEYLLSIVFVAIISFLLCFLYIPRKVVVADTENEAAVIVGGVVEAVYDPSAVVMTGELYKLGNNETFKSWKLREFVLLGNVLQYYELPRTPNDVSRGDFDISDSYVRVSDAEECSNKAATYSFIVYNHRTKIVLIAPSERIRSQWIEVIKHQIRSYHRVIHRIRLRAATEAAKASGGSVSAIDSIEEFDTDQTPPVSVYKVSSLRNSDGSRAFGVISNFRKGGAEREITSWMDAQNKAAPATSGAIRPKSESVAYGLPLGTEGRPKSTMVAGHKETSYAAMTARLQTEAAAAEAIRLATLNRLADEADLAEQAEFKRIAQEVHRKAEAEAAERRASEARLVEQASAKRAAAEAERRAEEAQLGRLAEEAQLAEEARQLEVEELRQLAEEARGTETARVHSEAQLARLVEEAQLAEEARQLEMEELERLAQESRAAECACLAEERELERKAEEARGALEARRREETKLRALTEAALAAEAARVAEEAKLCSIPEADRAAEEEVLHRLEREAIEAENARVAEEVEVQRAAERAQAAEQARAAEEVERGRLGEARRRAEEARVAEEARAKLADQRVGEVSAAVAENRAKQVRVTEAARSAEAALALEEAKLKRVAADARLKEAARAAEEAKLRRLENAARAAEEAEKRRLMLVAKAATARAAKKEEEEAKREAAPVLPPRPAAGRRPSFLHSPDRARDSDDEEDALESLALDAVLSPAAEAAAAAADADAAAAARGTDANSRQSIRSSLRGIEPEVVAITPVYPAGRLEISKYNTEFDAVASQFKQFFHPDLGDVPERIVFTSVIGKKNPVGIVYTRQLILTNTPRLFYVEPKAMILKGEITWTVSAPPTVEAINGSTLSVTTIDGKNYKFIDQVNGSAVWLQIMQSIIRQQRLQSTR